MNEIAQVESRTVEQVWLENVHSIWKGKLKDKKIEWKFNQQNGYLDRIWLKRGNDFLIVDVSFNEAKFITTIKPCRTNCGELWVAFREII